MHFLIDKLFNKATFFKKGLPVILLLLPCILLYRTTFENDTYWLLNTGKYILNHGFPITEPFTIHSGLSLSIQQWLTTVVFYFLYAHFGTVSLYILNIFCYFLLVVMIYLISMKLSNNRFISVSIAVFSSIFFDFQMALRPQIFSFLIFALEIYVLELYIKEKKWIFLMLLPLLSVLLVNFHSAMWLFFFVLYVPYILDGFNFKFSFIRGHGYGTKPLILTFIASFAVGILNPYGITNMLYLFSSYGNSLLNASVNEMKSPDFKSGLGIAIFILLLSISFIYIKFKGSTRLRYVLISIGTLYMALSSLRNLSIFIIGTLPFMAYYLKDINLPKYSGNKNNTLRRVLVFVICLLLIVAVVFRQYDYSDTMATIRPAGAADFILANMDSNKTRLYNEFNTGGYLEFRGIRTFIDSRAEVFLKSTNKKEDIIIEYIQAGAGRVYYKDFIEKYAFTHFLISRGTLLDIYLRADPKYSRIYTDDDFVIYKALN